MKPKFYITTAIVYASQKPHIGNLYDIIMADAIARYKRMSGFDVYYLTGSDDHGKKIEDNAAAAGVTPLQYVDDMVNDVIKPIWESVGSSHDQFIRTSDESHRRVVQRIFKKLYDQGDIYKGMYTDFYCVPCESFYTPTQSPDKICPDCSRPLEEMNEPAYFLKLSKYADRLLAHIDKNPDWLVPHSRKNEMVNGFIKPGLIDLCVSRASVKWGVPVCFDDEQVVYVWIDALSNYITALV